MAKERAIEAFQLHPGEPAQPVDLLPVFYQPEPFQAESINIPSPNPMDAQNIAIRFSPFDGLRNMVWLANNKPQDAWNPTEIILPGLFMFDEQSRQLLFVPHHTLPNRDTYRTGQDHFLTQEPLISILQKLIGNGSSLFQATLLNDLEAKSILNFPLGTRWEFAAFMGEVDGKFQEVTGLDKKINGFRREGETTLDRILAHDFFPVPLLTPGDLRHPQKTLAAIARGWK